MEKYSPQTVGWSITCQKHYMTDLCKHTFVILVKKLILETFMIGCPKLRQNSIILRRLKHFLKSKLKKKKCQSTFSWILEFHKVLVQVPFTRSETELDIYYIKRYAEVVLHTSGKLIAYNSSLISLKMIWAVWHV